MTPGRLELPTRSLGNCCSIHLSYGATPIDCTQPFQETAGPFRLGPSGRGHARRGSRLRDQPSGAGCALPSRGWREEIDKERFEFHRAIQEGKGSSDFSITNVVLAL